MQMLFVTLIFIAIGASTGREYGQYAVPQMQF